MMSKLKAMMMDAKQFFDCKYRYPIAYYHVLTEIEKSLKPFVNDRINAKYWVETTNSIAKDLCKRNVREVVNIFNAQSRQKAVILYHRRLKDIHDSIEDGIVQQNAVIRHYNRKNDQFIQLIQSMQEDKNA